MFGAVAGGAFKTVQQAQQTMTGVKETVYRPNKAAAGVYAELYALYRTLARRLRHGQLHRPRWTA